MKTKEVKIKEAEDRLDKYSAMSTKQKITALNNDGYRAEKVRRKLGFPEIPTNCTR